MPNIVGQIHTKSSGYESNSRDPGLRPLDVSTFLHLLEPKWYPLLGTLTNVGRVPADTQNGQVTWKGAPTKTRVVKDPLFYAFQDKYGDRFENLGTGPTSGVTTITVADGTIYAENDVLLLNDGTSTEQIRVSSVSGNDLTVVRGLDEDNAGTGVNFSGGAVAIYIIGSAYKEGATSVDGKTTIKTKEFNYTQIFRTPFEVTGTLANTELYTGDQLKESNTKKGVEHLQGIEYAAWLGRRYEEVNGGGKVTRYTGGVVERLEQGDAYVQDEASSSLTESEFNTFLENANGFGGGPQNAKWLYAGNRILGAVQDFARGAVRTTVGDKTYGIEISEYVSVFGKTQMIYNPTFENFAGGQYAGNGVLLDPDTVKYAYLQNRNTSLRQMIQPDDADARKDEFLTECGIDRVLFAKNGYLKNVA